MRKTKSFKITNILLILLLLLVNLLNFSTISIASNKDDSQNVYEFEVRKNDEKSSKPTKGSDGLDYYKAGDEIAVDVYLTTTSPNLAYLDFNVSSDDRYSIDGLDEFELGDELTGLENYIDVSTTTTVNGISFTFDNSQEENGVRLNNDKEIKLVTAYFKVKEDIMDKDYEITCNNVTAGANRFSSTPTKSNNYKFKLTEIPVKVEASADRETIYQGENVNITATVYTEGYLEEDLLTTKMLQDVVYQSSNEDVLKVFNDGTIRGMNAGNATLKVCSAVDNNVYTTIDIEVLESELATPVESIDIKNKIDTIQLGKEYTLDVGFTPENPEDKSIKYTSSNNDVATIDENGKIITNAIGKTTITVYSHNNKTDTMDLEVINNIEKIEILNPFSYSLFSQKYQLEVRVTPDDENNSNVNLVKYKSSNPEIARITDDGLIICDGGIGRVKITAYIGDIEDSFFAFFRPNESYVPITGFKITDKKENMLVGDTYELQTEITPINASNQLVKFYTSDSSIATVDENGIVSAHQVGNVTVTARCDEFQDSFELNVVEDEVPITNLELEKNALSMEVGEQETLSVKINPENTTEDKSFTVSSTDVNVAGVSINGDNIVIKANKAGKATITVTSTENEEIIDTCEVTIFGFSFENGTQNINKNEPTQLKVYSILPETDNEADYDITYESSNKNTVTVDENGTIIGKQDGFSRVTMTATNRKTGKVYNANVSVYVATPVKGVTITPKVMEIVVGEGLGFDISINPPDATTTYCTISSSDETVATVSRGIVMGLKEGKATITVKTNDGGFTDTCEVYVVSRLHEDTTVVEAESSTCTTHGHGQYEICNICGKIVNGSDEELPFAEHKGGTATCSKLAICEVCGQEYGEIDKNNHVNTEIRNKVDATTETEGYTGDLYCSDCGNLLEKGKEIPKLKENIEEDFKGEKDVTPNTGNNGLSEL